MLIPLKTPYMADGKNFPRQSALRSAAGRVAIFAAITLMLALGISSCGAGPKEAGIGKPVSSEGWEVTITGARVETQLGDTLGTYTTDQEGTVFFVIDYGILNKGGKEKFSLYATATSEKGETYHPRVMGFGFAGSTVYGGLEEGKAFLLEPGMAKDSAYTGSLGFIIPLADADQAYKIQFLDLPDASFLVEAAQ